MTVLVSSCAGDRATLRDELLAVHNDVELGEGCVPWWELKRLELLECDAVPQLVALLTDKAEVKNYRHHFNGRATVGAMAFFALGEMDEGLWEDVAYADQPIDGVLGFLAKMRVSPEPIRDAVVRRGVKCPAGGIKARAFDKMCPEPAR